MSFVLDAMEEIDSKVSSGEITGAVSWPLEGEAEVVEVGDDVKQGKPYLTITMIHSVKGKQTFLVRVPVASDKQTAKFMGMQKIYATLFSLGGCVPAKNSPKEAFQSTQNKLKTSPIRVRYKLSEYESVSPTTAKVFVNQSLETLTVVSGNSSDSDYGDFE
jgi:hypothetical protein